MRRCQPEEEREGTPCRPRKAFIAFIRPEGEVLLASRAEAKRETAPERSKPGFCAHRRVDKAMPFRAPSTRSAHGGEAAPRMTMPISTPSPLLRKRSLAPETGTHNKRPATSLSVVSGVRAQRTLVRNASCPLAATIGGAELFSQPPQPCVPSSTSSNHLKSLVGLWPLTAFD